MCCPWYLLHPNSLCRLVKTEMEGVIRISYSKVYHMMPDGENKHSGKREKENRSEKEARDYDTTYV